MYRDHLKGSYAMAIVSRHSNPQITLARCLKQAYYIKLNDDASRSINQVSSRTAQKCARGTCFFSEKKKKDAVEIEAHDFARRISLNPFFIAGVTAISVIVY